MSLPRSPEFSGTLRSLQEFLKSGSVINAAVDATASDEVITSTHEDNTITAESEGFTTGEGPYWLTNSGGDLPAGLSTDTLYWVIVVEDLGFGLGGDVLQLATSYANAIAGIAVPITDDGTGTHTLHIPSVFKLTALSDERIYINSILFAYGDDEFAAGEFGGLGDPLTHGVRLYARKADGTLEDLFDDNPVTKNFEWGRFCSVVELKSFSATEAFIDAIFDFALDGMPYELLAGDSIEIWLNDDLSGLQDFTIQARGVKGDFNV